MPTPSLPAWGFLPTRCLPGLLVLVLLAPMAHAQTELVLSAVPPTLAPLAEVAVYPNPAHIRATVQVPAVPGAIRATVALLNAQGQVVFTQPLSLPATGATTDVPLLGLPPGPYRLQILAGDQRVSRPLTVE